MSLIYTDTKLSRDPPKWRFQLGWLLDPEFVDYLGKQIDIHFETNLPETYAGVRWEAFKAFLRGQIISFCSSKSKQELIALEMKIKKLKSEIYQNDSVSTDLHKQLLLLQSEYNTL